jgi:ankyrin repeat protein
LKIQVMNIGTIGSKWAVFAAAGALIFTGCGGDDSEEAASADWLQQNGYSVTVNDYLLAAEAGDLQAVELMRTGGIAVDAGDEASGDTALIRAAGTGQMEMIRHLLSEGADVALTNKAGRPALTLAAQEGHTEVVRLLLSYGADPAVKDKDGWNALTAAAFQGREGAVEVLAGKMKDDLDDSLLVASLQGHPRVVDQLLNRGAYVNTRSDGGQTPLMLAAKGGHLNVVEMLMSNSANPYALDRNDNTAATLAKRGGYGEVAEYLLQPENASQSSPEEAAQELVESSDADASIDGVVLMVPDAPNGETPAGYELADAAGEEISENGEPQPVVDGEAANAAEDSTPVAGATVDNAVDGATPSLASDAAPVIASADDEAVVRAAVAASASADGTEAAADADAEAERSPLHSMRMESYREKPLPVMLSSVEGDSAEVRVLSRPSSSPKAASQPTSISNSNLASKPAPISTASTVPQSTTVPQSSAAAARVNAAITNATGASLPAAPAAASTSASNESIASSSPGTIRVREGEIIEGTNYRVASVDTKFVSSKEGKGQLTDVSQMTVEDTATGEKHLLVKDVPGRSAVTYAVVTMQPGSQRYVVHENDKFSAVNNRNKTEEFQVLEIRPTQVLIENLSTRKVVTIEREGVAVR